MRRALIAAAIGGAGIVGGALLARWSDLDDLEADVLAFNADLNTVVTVQDEHARWLRDVEVSLGPWVGSDYLGSVDEPRRSALKRVRERAESERG